MPQITFIDHTGEKRSVAGEVGATVMEAAVKNAIPGIVAECGGACSCATCHVHVDPAWSAQVGAATGMERDMLEFAEDVRDTSRLSCQVKVAPALDGLVVHLPAGQG